jgi:hypothetical protein
MNVRYRKSNKSGSMMLVAICYVTIMNDYALIKMTAIPFICNGISLSRHKIEIWRYEILTPLLRIQLLSH